MAQVSNIAEPAGANRRGFLKRVLIGAAAVGAYIILTKRPFGGAQRQSRSIPANLPGKGSIFRPRNDRRSP